VEGAGAKASRLFLQRFSTFFESLPIPADASGAYRPDPQATTKPAPGPPSLKGYSLMLSEHKKAVPGVSLICPIRGRRGLRGMGKFPDVFLIQGHSTTTQKTLDCCGE
jgi:hypothetical protein